MSRTAQAHRTTAETDITCSINLDGKGTSRIATGIGFLDHMLTLFAKHGCFDLEITANGDLEVDCHHTVEDIGIVLGGVIRDALGDKAGITRYGSCLLPMDETLVQTALDLSGRPYLVYHASFGKESIGALDTEMIHEFFYAMTYTCGMNLNIRVLDGENSHHIAEAMFKSFARALREAVAIDPRVDGIPSTKGSLI